MANGSNKERLDAALTTGPVVTCMKTLMMVFNFIFWVTGIVILAIGIWTKVDMYQYLELSSIYRADSPYVLIGTGAVIALVGSIGCCCTMKGHATLLYVFSAVLFLVFIVELSCGATILVYRGKLEKGFMEGLTNALERYGTEGQDEITSAVDSMQRKLVCCGITKYTDWYGTPYSKSQDEKTIPESCCKVDAKRCQHVDIDDKTAKTNIHTQGCHSLVVDFVNGNMGPIGGVALGISFFQVLGALLAFCLAKSINRSKYEQVA